MPKWVKFILGLLLLPVCASAIAVLLRVIAHSGGADAVWVPLLAGAVCWVIIFVLLPKPMWIYVFGHELSHAVWNWLFGGKLKAFRASSKGGHVVVTKN